MDALHQGTTCGARLLQENHAKPISGLFRRTIEYLWSQTYAMSYGVAANVDTVPFLAHAPIDVRHATLYRRNALSLSTNCQIIGSLQKRLFNWYSQNLQPELSD
jgi:hypothetical protein